MSYFRENIEKTQGYTPGFQPKAEKVIKLNTNENPYPPSPKVMQALANMRPEKLRRYPQPAGDDFRQAAAEVLGVKPDNIMCSNGGDDLLNIAIRSFCDQLRPLAYPTPTYSLYPELANLQSTPVIEVPFNDNYELPENLADVTAALTIVCNPNAPSATLISKDKIAKLAGNLKGVLLIDEAYVDFAENNCISLINDFDNVIILRSLSKGYSLAGIRFGFALACKSLIDGMMKVKDSYNVDAVAIEVATQAIKDQTYFKENVQKVKADRKILTEKLRALGFIVTDSSTNFVFAQNPKADEIYNRLIEKNIYVRYFKNLPGLGDKLRITVGTAQQNQILIDALKEILSEKGYSYEKQNR
ncbi:MAG TPA: histidinol-phosphate transaminase [Sedimentisphaerales bacterium]|nr:histidinol-phosphate transaminase [Sedimentisphaerales bacterium]